MGQLTIKNWEKVVIGDEGVWRDNLKSNKKCGGGVDEIRLVEGVSRDVKRYSSDEYRIIE